VGLSNSAQLASGAAHLSVQMHHRQGALDLAVAFELTQPWTVLFGPSGSGKSTVLRAIAGFLRPDEGRIVFRGRRGDAQSEQILTETAQGVFVASHLRPIRWSAQSSPLFPHLTVRKNVAYGVPDAEQIVDEAMDRMQLNAFAKKMSWELSGGERQRVTLARAIAAAMTGEHLLLLDEPFVGLDLRLRDELLADLLLWRESTGTPVLSVTHNIGETFQLGAEVVRIAEGKVVGQGPAEEVLAPERERLLRQLTRPVRSGS
jgi:molybdate transport system ATP-binding protein